MKGSNGRHGSFNDQVPLCKTNLEGWREDGKYLKCMELRKWFRMEELKAFRVLPRLVLWGIWLSHNDNIFNDKQKPTVQVYSQVYGLFQGCKMEVKEKIPRQTGVLLIEKPNPWDFFDGAKQRPQGF
jgi:hypothetical protein